MSNIHHCSFRKHPTIVHSRDKTKKFRHMTMIFSEIKKRFQLRKRHNKEATRQTLEVWEKSLRDYYVRLSEKKSFVIATDYSIVDDQLKPETEVQVEVDPKPNEKPTPIRGIRINRDDGLEVRQGERFQLYRGLSKHRGRLVDGYVIKVDGRSLYLKFDEPIVFDERAIRKNCHEIVFGAEELRNKRRNSGHALRRYRDKKFSFRLHKTLAGRYKDDSNIKFRSINTYTAGFPLYSEPTKEQESAILQSMQKRISLVEGIAGSGKTCIAASIARSLATDKRQKVLICSPFQGTVDTIASMLIQTNSVSVVQLPSADIMKNRGVFERKSRGGSESRRFDPYHLNELIEQQIFLVCLEKFQLQRHSPKDREKAFEAARDAPARVRYHHGREIIKKCAVVCCTFAQAADIWLKGIKFDSLIIDDAQGPREFDCLVPLAIKGIKQLTLIGDLRSNIRLPRSNRVGEKRHSRNKSKTDLITRKRTEFIAEVDGVQREGSLFERCFLMGISSVVLYKQFRMHQNLIEPVNKLFYRSKMEIHEATQTNLDRQIYSKNEPNEIFKWLPNSNITTALFDTKDVDYTVSELLKRLIEDDRIEKSRIEIITNLDDGVHRHSRGIRMESIEDVYGKEQDFVIVACRKLSESIKNLPSRLGIGCDFLRSDGALNVALTRARLGLFIVADHENLETGRGDDQGKSPAQSHDDVQNESEKKELDCSSERTAGDKMDYQTTGEILSKSWISLVKHYSSRGLISQSLSPQG